MYVIVCLGVEPLAFGSFNTMEEVEDALTRHLDALADFPSFNWCNNGCTREEHNILTLQKSG